MPAHAGGTRSRCMYHPFDFALGQTRSNVPGPPSRRCSC